LLVRRGVTWYAPWIAGTPSNGEPLQITNTAAARFLRGLYSQGKYSMNENTQQQIKPQTRPQVCPQQPVPTKPEVHQCARLS
jgi:hypothetical protein